jgi:hypothetical protein
MTKNYNAKQSIKQVRHISTSYDVNEMSKLLKRALQAENHDIFKYSLDTVNYNFYYVDLNAKSSLKLHYFRKFLIKSCLLFVDRTQTWDRSNLMANLINILLNTTKTPDCVRISYLATVHNSMLIGVNLFR